MPRSFPARILLAYVNTRPIGSVGEVRQARKEWSSALPPTMIFETLALTGNVEVPLSGRHHLRAHTPTRWRAVNTPGYDKDRGLYLDLNGVMFPPVPEAPTQEDAKAALDTLYAPFADFPFKEIVTASAALAAVRLPLVGRTRFPAVSRRLPSVLTLKVQAKGCS